MHLLPVLIKENTRLHIKFGNVESISHNSVHPNTLIDHG